MSDISKCEGLRIKNHKAEICTLRDKCKRYTVIVNPYHQSWIKPPFEGDKCEIFYEKNL